MRRIRPDLSCYVGTTAMKSLAAGAVLSILAAGLLGVGSLSPGWYEEQSSQTMRVGPIGAERCSGSQCGRVSLDAFEAGSGTRRLGLVVALTGILAGLGVLAAAGLGLKRRESRGLAPRAALALALFAICGGLAFHLLTPFSEVMSVGPPAFLYFAGAALAGATAAIPLRAVGQAQQG